MAYLKGVQDAGQRAAKIVANMLSFSRRGDANKEFVDLNQLLEKSLELATSDYDLKRKYDFRHIKIIREYDATLPQVPCISMEIEQVILNLLKNAAQALAEKREVSHTPQIRIRTQKESSYAMICIEDNGPGMDEYAIKRIFEPFFTTKPIGTGTGLGLSVSYFIIEAHHNGKLTADSTLGEGTKFMIRLPCIASTR
jgi:signal transduction histidine kinase